MKKNWLSYICMATLLSGALTSCNENKFLDLKDPNHFTEENFCPAENEVYGIFRT